LNHFTPAPVIIAAAMMTGAGRSVKTPNTASVFGVFSFFQQAIFFLEFFDDMSNKMCHSRYPTKELEKIKVLHGITNFAA
jgi:hypothetical protein